MCFVPNRFTLVKGVQKCVFLHKIAIFWQISAAANCVYWPKWVHFEKTCSKVSVLCQKGLFWQKRLKTVCFVLNRFIWGVQNCVFLYEMALFWQKLLQTVCFVLNGFILANPAQSCFFLAKISLFWQKVL